MTAEKEIEFLKTEIKPEDILPNQSLGFDNEGNVILRTRAYRRRKIQVEIDPKMLPKKKKRKKNNKRNFLTKRKK